MTDSFAMRVSPAPDVMFRIVGDEAVLLHLKSEIYLGLDPVGTRMWTVLTESESVEKAYAALLEEYDVEGQCLRRDIEEFIGKLVEHDLVALNSPDVAVKETP
jgi:hypothetical protein